MDRSGNAYVTGSTTTPGSGFPGTAGSLIQSTFGGGIPQPVPKSGDRRDCCDAFVTKINAAGTAILYSTYLGGSGFDEGLGIAVDQIGNAYVVGTTNTQGSDFPGTAASDIQSINAGGGDAFIAKVNAAGTAILYSTYLRRQWRRRHWQRDRRGRRR